MEFALLQSKFIPDGVDFFQKLIGIQGIKQEVTKTDPTLVNSGGKSTNCFSSISFTVTSTLIMTRRCTTDHPAGRNKKEHKSCWKSHKHQLFKKMRVRPPSFVSLQILCYVCLYRLPFIDQRHLITEPLRLCNQIKPYNKWTTVLK